MEKTFLETVTDQILLSLALSDERRAQLLQLAPTLPKDKLQALKAIFDEEQKRKDELLKQALANDPKLVDEIDRFARENIAKMYKEVESKEHPLEEEQMEDILKQL